MNRLNSVLKITLIFWLSFSAACLRGDESKKYIAQSPDAKVVQLQAIKQTSYGLGLIHEESQYGCGFWTIVNTAAVQKVLALGQELSGENVQREAYHFANKGLAYVAERINSIESKYQQALLEYQLNGSVGHCPIKDPAFNQGIAWLNAEQLIELAKYFELETVYFVVRENDGLLRLRCFSTHENQEKGHQDTIAQLQQCNSCLMHPSKRINMCFCCYDGGHWRMIAIVKEPGNQAQLVVLDSLNWRFNHPDGGYTRAFIEYVKGSAGLSADWPD